MRIIIIADVHGRKCWKDIIKSEKYDLIVFLGDYVSTHEGISPKEQIDNLREILQFKEDNKDKVILLRGNHDLQHCGYYWAECSGESIEVEKWLSARLNRERFLRDTQWIYKYNNIIFSHAGISKSWLKSANCLIKDINKLEPSSLWGFTAGPDNPFDYYGESIYQPPTWIRPDALLKDTFNKRYTQVVGHTTMKRIFNIKEYDDKYPNIWFCDCCLKQYLVIDNGKFEVKEVPAIQ